MKLEKSDLNEIRKIVKEEVKEIVRDEVTEIVDEKIQKTEKKLMGEIQRSEGRVIATISREVQDLADINRAVIKKVDKVDNLEKRVIVLEEEVGISA